ncbi:MAG TPA: response regulator transcription factor [Trueperaceae bacterium]|nr:response regulator transcription factor [Trueperaceae bacterium]
MAKKILIADDHALFRIGIRYALNAKKFNVVAEAATGYEAINLALLEQPDLAILDIKMPELDGIAACKEILKYSPNTLIIMLTTFEEPAILLAAKKAGAKACLSKETEIDVLVKKLEDILKYPNYSWFPNIEVPELTNRESQVLKLLVDGLSNKEIAKELSLSPETVKDYLQNIYQKLGVSDRHAASKKSRELGLLMFA